MESYSPIALDADLQAKLPENPNAPGYQTLRRLFEDEQAERNRIASLSPVARRRAKAKECMAADPACEDRHHIHSVLALCALPYRRPPEGSTRYHREYGKSSLIVQSGYLADPATGRMVEQGLPYGTKARLLLMHVCTTAVRQNSNKIEIADSMSAFIRDMGFPVTGGARGTITQFKEQLNRLAAAHMQIGLWSGDHSTTINTHPIKSFDMWLPSNPDQRTLWSTSLTLDREFYESLRQHALPIDTRALRPFTQSARQIDMVLWLAYRLRSVRKSYLISWAALKEQFGSDYAHERFFRRDFAADLAAITEVFPRLPARITERGMMLSPADPELLFAQPVKSLA